MISRHSEVAISFAYDESHVILAALHHSKIEILPKNNVKETSERLSIE